MKNQTVALLASIATIVVISAAYNAAKYFSPKNAARQSANFPAGIDDHGPVMTGEVSPLKSFKGHYGQHKVDELTSQCVQVVYKTNTSQGNYVNTVLEYLQCRTGNLECVIVSKLGQISCVKIE